MGARANRFAGSAGLAVTLLLGAALAACEIKTAAAPARTGSPAATAAAPSASAQATPATQP